jgi:hypothetical protein
VAISKICLLDVGLGEKCESIKTSGETIEIARLAFTDLSWRALSD